MDSDGVDWRKYCQVTFVLKMVQQNLTKLKMTPFFPTAGSLTINFFKLGASYYFIFAFYQLLHKCILNGLFRIFY